jgi:CRISPR-associated protein Csx17
LGQRLGFRRRLLPIDVKTPRQWGRIDDPGFVFSERPLVDNLHALLLRDDLEAQQGKLRLGTIDAHLKAACRLDDLAQFIEGTVDDVAIERWARASSLLSEPPRFVDQGQAVGLPATFAVLRLVHGEVLDDGTTLKRTATTLARACTGDAVGATTAALQRLASVGRALPVPALVEPTERTRRIAAALAFPLTAAQRRQLEDLVLPPPPSRPEPSQRPEAEAQKETV